MAGAWTIWRLSMVHGYPAQCYFAQWAVCIDGTAICILLSFSESKNGAWIPKDLSQWTLTWGSARTFI